MVAVSRDDRAYALDARSGATLWRTQGVGGTGLLGGASPAADGQLVVLPFASGEVLGVLGRNGLTVWGTAVTGGRRDLARNRINDISGDPVIDGDWVYASNQSGRTVRLDRRSGERAWTMAEGSYGPAWPVGGSVFLLSDIGTLVRADAATGGIIWSAQLPEMFPNRGIFGRGVPFRRCPTTGRCWREDGSGWPEATASCAASTRRTAPRSTRCRSPAAPRPRRRWRGACSMSSAATGGFTLSNREPAAPARRRATAHALHPRHRRPAQCRQVDPFNRLVGRRLALVDDQPGVTRDLREGQGRLGALRFTGDRHRGP